MSRAGWVALVGAGPGDPDLVTVRGLRRLQAADVVVHDRLVHPDLVAAAPARAERVDVGKAPGRPSGSQAFIHRLLVEKARAGAGVVRLKGGDPFVFGRGGEELVALVRAGVPVEVVPAATSALAVPALAGIPVTHRGVAAGFAVVTGHRAPGHDDATDWAALARIDTLVVLMGVARLGAIVAALVVHGRDPETPAAIIERGASPRERVVAGPLARLPRLAADAGIRPPATTVIGEVVRIRDELAKAVRRCEGRDVAPLDPASPPTPLTVSTPVPSTPLVLPAEAASAPATKHAAS